MVKRIETMFCMIFALSMITFVVAALVEFA